ncbi:GyrI-like domain-containing protein [Demequina aurantiaca]|uniref:GyrI-like domain-containing protein n=1 Tax=Demequina aurantiaca TaxID=676200 RepID=UPI003D332BBC
MSNATFRAEHREPLTYVALPVTVTITDMGERVAAAYRQIELYLASRGINPSGPGVVRYRGTDQRGAFAVEVGWVIPENTWIDLPYVAELLPAGRYAVAAYTGPYSALDDVSAEVMMWADLTDLALDVAAGGGEWVSRVELYLDDPRVGVDGLEGAVEVCILTRN